MYDADSLVRLVCEVGFERPSVLRAGNTTIPDPGELNLQERAEESIYIEATRGTSAPTENIR
jgi:hypothetical protein